MGRDISPAEAAFCNELLIVTFFPVVTAHCNDLDGEVVRCVTIANQLGSLTVSLVCL